MRISADERKRFDDALEEVLGELPGELTGLLEEMVVVVVEDFPSEKMVRELDLEDGGAGLFGLHWGVAITEKSVEESGSLPGHITLFRGPILQWARQQGRRRDDALQKGKEGNDVLGLGKRKKKAGGSKLKEQIRITLLHEIGHHFGLNEDDLDRLGYG